MPRGGACAILETDGKHIDRSEFGEAKRWNSGGSTFSAGYSLSRCRYRTWFTQLRTGTMWSEGKMKKRMIAIIIIAAAAMLSASCRSTSRHANDLIPGQDLSGIELPSDFAFPSFGTVTASAHTTAGPRNLSRLPTPPTSGNIRVT